MRVLELFLERFCTLLVYVAALAVIALTGFVCLSAIMRYVLGTPFHFTEELVALLFLTTVFLTLPYSALRRQHISVTLLTGRLRGMGSRLMQIVNLTVVLVFSVWFFSLSLDFTLFGHELGARSEQSDLLLWPWMALMPLTLALVAVVSVWQVILVLRGQDPAHANPHSDP